MRNWVLVQIRCSGKFSLSGWHLTGQLKDTREVYLGEEHSTQGTVGRGLRWECTWCVRRTERELVRHPIGLLGATELSSLLLSLQLLITRVIFPKLLVANCSLMVVAHDGGFGVGLLDPPSLVGTDMPLGDRKWRLPSWRVWFCEQSGGGNIENHAWIPVIWDSVPACSVWSWSYAHF